MKTHKNLSFIFFCCFLWFLMLSSQQVKDAEAQDSESGQRPPKIAWAQGGLRGLHWGMSKSDVEHVLGCKLRLYSDGQPGPEYSCNLSTTWIENVRITFSSNRISDCTFDFYHGKLFGMDFSASNGWEKNIYKTVLSKFGEGAPSSRGFDYFWSDDETQMSMIKEGYINLIEWKTWDDIIGDNRHQEDYYRYCRWWRRQNSK